MNLKQLERMRNAKGFIAALDQSGGSTPKALASYGVAQDSYQTEEEMFRLVHEMRTRIVTAPAFGSDRILGTILFEQTMEREVEGKPTADYLWDVKGIVPFLKIDKGLEEKKNGVQKMRPMPQLDELLKKAVTHRIFGTKERSVIHEADTEGIAQVVKQQVEVGLQVFRAGMVPILEPEVNIHSETKAEAEAILKKELLTALDALDEDVIFMLKLSIPTEANFYRELIEHPRVLRVVALSGGYSRDEADRLLKQNEGMIASFSRALLDGLKAQQTDEEFNEVLNQSMEEIYQASI